MLLRFSSVLALAAAVLIAGCGGSNAPSGSSTGSGGSQKRAVNLASVYKFSACMRDNGVTNFPDPQVSNQGGSQSVRVQINPSITGSPDFKSAQKTCAHLLPAPGKFNGPNPAQVRQRTQALVAFAGCMRQHGFSRFPDPNAQGQLSPAAIQSSGINLQAPAVQPVADACTSVTHGVVTKADVAQAIANDSASQSAG